MSKVVRIFDVQVKTTKEESNWIYWRKDPDPYLFFKSQRATVGDRESATKNTFNPKWEHSWHLPLGDASDPEDVTVEVWDANWLRADYIMEICRVDFAKQDGFGTATFRMSAGGSLKMSWEITGRGGPGYTEPTGRRIMMQELAFSLAEETTTSKRWVTVTGRSVSTGIKIEAPVCCKGKAPDEGCEVADRKELVYDPMGYTVEMWEKDDAMKQEYVVDQSYMRPNPKGSGNQWQEVHMEEGGTLHIRYATTGFQRPARPPGQRPMLPAKPNHGEPPAQHRPLLPVEPNHGAPTPTPEAPIFVVPDGQPTPEKPIFVLPEEHSAVPDHAPSPPHVGPGGEQPEEHSAVPDHAPSPPHIGPGGEQPDVVPMPRPDPDGQQPDIVPMPRPDPDGQRPDIVPMPRPDPDAEDPDDMPVVERKEIRRMPVHEQERFVVALKQMCVNKNGQPGTSEFARLAGYHGWPNNYCQHGEESFPGWHRAYLTEFETALQVADREVGNDGLIGLPYWDWTDTEVNGEVFPRILRREFELMPPDLVDRVRAGTLGSTGYRLHDDDRVRWGLERARLATQVNDCLSVSEHWVHASTRFTGSGMTSCEQPHNSVHTALGFPMTSATYAAFHPVFWLHHCNVDRIYEKHIQMESAQESMSEFSARQRMLHTNAGERNRFLEPFFPFKHPQRPDEDILPRDTFDTRELLYVYDSLPPDPRMEMNVEPTFTVFKGVKPLDLNYKSFQLHVFLLPEGQGAEFEPPADGVAAYGDSPNYAGVGSLFGGKGKECTNCATRKPYNVQVEVGESLRKLQLSRYETDIVVMCEDEVGNVKPWSRASGIPNPILIGPLFEDLESEVLPSTDPADTHLHMHDGEKMTILRELKKYGFLCKCKLQGRPLPAKYSPDLDEAFKDAVTTYQNFYGLEETGKVNREMKQMLLGSRNDTTGDVYIEESGPGRKYIQGSTMRYMVADLPGYLDRAKALAEMDEAVKKWGKAMGVMFKRTPSSIMADFRIVFDDLSPVLDEFDDDLPRAGGQLAEANAQGIKLDASERWLLTGQEKPCHVKQAFMLYNVVIHEMGHVLGLTHTSKREDIMWPFYRGDVKKPDLSPNDVERARGLVTSDKGRFRPSMVPLYDDDDKVSHSSTDSPKKCCCAKAGGKDKE